jgi:hypothetical protein
MSNSRRTDPSSIHAPGAGPSLLEASDACHLRQIFDANLVAADAASFAAPLSG